MPEETKHHHAHADSDRVLATLNADGSRRWIMPRLSPGRFLTARRVLAYFLIALFALLPYITINGKPAILLDIVHRRFTFFGITFMPTDTLLLAAVMLIIVVGIFLITALFGRVWCGWACPQTVYMEFLYRPIERLIEGAPGSKRAKTPPSAVKKALKYSLFLLASLYLAHIFLAYFVGVDQLAQWIRRSPFEHPTSFLIMAATTALMMFDFAFFREQTCLVACPYGRLQSVMIDRHSLIITYDTKRGEPRGKKHRAPDHSLPILTDQPATGDCIDCHMCVTTCPTGIDIRNGLQMECIGCAQCIDACDTVMDKIKRPRGLIRYSSQAIIQGSAKSFLRPRTLLYPAILLGLISFFTYILISKPPAEAAILPRQSTPFFSLPTGEVANQVRLRLVNRTDLPAAYTISIPDEFAAKNVHIILDTNPIHLEPGAITTVGFILAAPPESFSNRGRYDTSILITNTTGFSLTLPYRMLGPVHRAAAPKDPSP